AAFTTTAQASPKTRRLRCGLVQILSTESLKIYFLEVVKMKFKGLMHEQRFYETLGKMKSGDVEHRPVAYLLSLNKDLFRHKDEVFSFKADTVKLDCLKAGWQTSGSRRATRLMFNLWNGQIFNDDDDLETSCLYTPCELFADNDGLYYLEAVKLRFPWIDNSGVQQ
ncbi:MAG: DUF6075 family protein, partial [Muribaculaceae bacterium]|nr:DUF6075 family protein [Muribaculaceae bacterium]